MKKRVLSLFTALALCFSLLPSAIFAEADSESNYVAKVGTEQYETLEAAIDEADEEEITLLCNIEEDISISFPATINMAGFSITGNIEAYNSLTLTNGTVIGSVTSDTAFIMTAPADAKTAIDGGLKIIDGSCSISGAEIGVTGTLYVDSSYEFTVTGTDKAVLLTEKAEPESKSLYGAVTESGDTAVEAVFETDTYTVGGEIAKKLSNKQVGGETPIPAPITLTIAPEYSEIYAGESAEFTVTYDGTDTLEAYIQKNGQDETIDAAYDADTGIVTVTTTEEVKARSYTLYVHEINDTSIAASANITVKNVVAKDSDGNYYSDIKTAVEGAADGSTITVIAKDNQLSLPDGIYVETGDKGITLDLNGHSLDGSSLNVGGLTVTSKVRTGKLTVTDSSGGNGAVGLIVRDGGTVIFESENVNTALLQLQVYGGNVTLRGGHINAGQCTLKKNVVKLSDLIPSDEGYAYRFYRGVNDLRDWVPLADAQNNTVDTTFGLAVMKCEHAGTDADNHCLYCGTALVAKNGSKYYTSFKDAIAAANENDTVTLLKSVDEQCTIEKNMTLDLGGNNNMNSNITIKSGSTLTLAGEGIVNVVQSGTSGDGVAGGALSVASDEVIVNFLSVQQIPKPEMNLSKGTFWKIELFDNLKDMKANELLAEGYAFTSTGSGNVVNGYVYRLDNVKVVSHTHDTKTDNKCVCGYTCNHSNGFTDDGKCPDCGLQCQAIVVDSTGASQYYANLQDAIDALHNHSDINAVINLLSDVTGTYTIDKGMVRMNLNGHTLQSLLVTGSGSLSPQGTTGTIKELTFDEATAKFISAAWPVLGQITISGGASWSSILPDSNYYEEFGSIYGYKVYNDNGTYKWYDRNTAGDYAENGTVIKNVSILSLPVSVPTLTFNKEPVANGDTISVYKPYTFGINLATEGADCTIYYKWNGETRNCLATYSTDGYYESMYRDTKFGTAGSFEIWTVVTKDGYTRTSDTLTVNIGKADLSEAKITLKNGGKLNCDAWERDYFNELTMEIDAVTYFGVTLTTNDYTVVSGDKGTNVGGYTLQIEAKENSNFVGSATADWEILPCELTEAGFVNRVKPYDGTTDVTLENSIFGQEKTKFYCPSKGSFGGDIELIKDTDYEVKIVSSTFTSPNAYATGKVKYIVKLLNPNFAFDNGSDTKEFTTDHIITVAEKLPEGYEPNEGTLVVRNGVENSYTFDVSAMLKELPETLHYNSAEKSTAYSLKEYGSSGASLVSLDGTYYTEGTASIDENGILTLPIEEVKTTNEGSIGTVKVRVVTQNYNDFYVTVNVTAENRIKPTGKPKLSRERITYGEPISSIELSGTMHDGVNDVEVTGKFAWKGNTDMVPDVGSVLSGWRFTPDNSVLYAPVEDDSLFYVDKAKLPEDAIIEAPAAISGLIYQLDVSTPQVLHTKGKIKSGVGTMKYTLGDPESADTVWSEEPVASRSAGEFTVYYKIFGDSNHLDSAYGEIKCGIAKYEIKYDITCLPKVYDGTTDGDPNKVDNVKFYSNTNESKEITLKSDEYTVIGIKYNSANVGENLGTLPVAAKATISFSGDAAVNYTLVDGDARGLITPAPFKDIDLNSYTYEICYGEISPRSVTPTSFGAPDSLNYEIYSDMIVSSNEVLSKFDITSHSFFTFRVKEGLKDDAVGKSVTVKFNIYSKDHNYRSEDLTFTVKIIDKATPELYVNPVSAVYNGKPVPASLIDGKATINGHEISGTWSWENGAPTEVKDSGEYTVLFTPTYSYLYYGATEKAKVTVTPRDIGNKDITFPSGDSFVYTGNVIIPYIYGEYKYDENIEALELHEDEDYTLIYPEDAINVGKKTITVTGHGNFGGTTELEYEIIPCAIAPTVELTPTEYTYDGSKKTPKATITVNGTELTEGKDFKVEYSNNENAEDGAKAIITAMGNYSFETVEKSFSISKANSVIDTAPAANNFTYDSLSHYLVTDGVVKGGTFEYKLGDGEWTRDIPMAMNAAEYIVWYRVIGDSNHNGITENSLKVTIEKKDIANADIVLGPSLTYNREEQEQTISKVVTDNKINATFDVTNNRAADAGTYKLKVIGTGNFTGVRFVDFTIAKKEVTASVSVGGTYIYNGKEIKPTNITVKDGDAVIPGSEYTASFENNQNAGKAKVIIINAENGNYIVTGSGEFEINKAIITVKPMNISKVYGGELVFALESESNLISAEELEAFAKTAEFTSDGTANTAPVTENGYEISAQLTNKETANLILEVGGTGILTVTPAPLTITVNDVSREYGAANPELSVSYGGFVNGENESVLEGTLTLTYDESINDTTPVDNYIGKTAASGLTGGNYDITYVPGNVTITKIPVNASAGTAGKTYLNAIFDRSLDGLSATNFIVEDYNNNRVDVTNVTVTSDGKGYTLAGSFEVGRQYTVKVVLNGAAADATHNIVNGTFVITPVYASSSGIGGGGSGSGNTGYTVSFDTNGGSKLSNKTIAKNSVIEEPEIPIKDGYEFAGWYTDKELKTKYDFSEKVTNSITLYAAWTEKDNSDNQIILTIGEKAAKVFGITKLNDVAPKIVNDRTMLPARFVAENLGAEVSWDGEKELVTIKGKNLKTDDDITILIYIDSDIAYVNGKEIKLDSAAFVENDRTYTPVRFISEELGADVEWIESEQKVVITKNAEEK